MRRALLFAPLALFAARHAAAQKPPGQAPAPAPAPAPARPPAAAPGEGRLQVRILEAGIFRVTVMPEAQPGAGLGRSVRVKETLDRATTTVTARLGVHFGVRFQVTGSRRGATVPVVARLIYPEPGLRAPSAAEPERFSDAEMVVRVGDAAPSFRGFGFDDEWEIVRGTWRFEFRIGDEVFAAQEFRVEAP